MSSKSSGINKRKKGNTTLTMTNYPYSATFSHFLDLSHLGGGYVHSAPKNEGHVFAARDSEERCVEMKKKLEVKRLKNAVEKKKQDMQRYLSPELEERKKKQKINPLFELKGAARCIDLLFLLQYKFANYCHSIHTLRAAQDKYKDPNYHPVTEADEVDLLASLHGKMSAHPEGINLLDKMYLYASKAHSLLGYSFSISTNLEPCITLLLFPKPHPRRHRNIS